MSDLNHEIHIPVIKSPSCGQMQNKVTMTTGEATTGLAAVNDGAVLKENQERRKFPTLGSFISTETVVDTNQIATTSEGYLRPVDNNNEQADPGRSRLFSPNHPRAKPRVQKSSARDRKKIFQCNTNSTEGWASQTQTSYRTTRYIKQRRLFNIAPASDLSANQIAS